MRHEVRPFTLSPAFDLLLGFFPVKEKFSMQLIVKNKFRKEMKDIYNYRGDFEVVEIDG